VDVGRAQTARDHVSVFDGACVVVGREHFARHLSVSGLVGADESQAVASDMRGESEEEQEAADEGQDDVLPGRGEGGIRGDGVEQA
jgi:hypothetical protein